MLLARSIVCEGHLRRHASTTTAAVATSATPTAATTHGRVPSGPFGGSGCDSCPDFHWKDLTCGVKVRGTHGTSDSGMRAPKRAALRQYEHPVRHGCGTAYMSTQASTEASRERNLTTRGCGGAGGWWSAISRVQLGAKASPKLKGAKRDPDLFRAHTVCTPQREERSDQIEGMAAMRARSPPTQRACDDDPGSRGAPGGRFVA